MTAAESILKYMFQKLVPLQNKALIDGADPNTRCVLVHPLRTSGLNQFVHDKQLHSNELIQFTVIKQVQIVEPPLSEVRHVHISH